MTEFHLREARRGPDERVVVLTLERPAKANAYTQAGIATLGQRLGELASDESVGALVLTGSGTRSFCAGADLEELAALRFEDGLDLVSRQVFERLARMPVPTLAAINGAAIGGGLELSLSCDVRLAAPSAFFGLPELSRGLLPAAGAMRRLPRIIGDARARELILFDRTLDATTAASWGLLNYVGNDFLELAVSWAELAARRDRVPAALAKRCLAGSGVAAIELETVAQAALYERRETRES